MKLLVLIACLILFIIQDVLGDDAKSDEKVIHFEKQDSCMRACPRIYSPVCGSDGETYANDCEMATASCRIAKAITVKHSGEC